MYNPAQEISSISFDKIIGGTLNAVVDAQNNASLTTVNFIKSVGFDNDENGNPVKPVYVDFKYPKEVSPYRPAVADSYYFTVTDGGSGYSEEELNAGGYSVEGTEGVKLRFTVNGEGTITSVTTLEGGDNIGKDGKITLIAKSGSGASFAVGCNKGSPARAATYKDMTLQVPILTMMPIPFIRIATTDLEFNVKINSVTSTENTSSTEAKASTSASYKHKGLLASGGININASVSHQSKKSEKEEVKKEYSLNIKIHAVQDDMPEGLSRILDVLEESIVPKTDNGRVAGKASAAV